jgi:type IV pilus assembly protein PilO
MWDKLTAQQKDAIKAGLILGFVLLIGVAAYYWQFAKPEVEAAEKKVTALDSEIANLKKQIREMDDAAANVEKLKEKQRLLEEVAAKLPSTAEPQEFFRTFSEVLKITRMSYSEMKQLPLLERAIYTEIPYQIVGRGRYHDFGQFLNLIEENPNRLMRIKTFVIENDDNRPSVHPLKVQLATFKFNVKG